MANISIPDAISIARARSPCVTLASILVCVCVHTRAHIYAQDTFTETRRETDSKREREKETDREQWYTLELNDAVMSIEGYLGTRVHTHSGTGTSVFPVDHHEQRSLSLGLPGALPVMLASHEA